jgi:putative membrane protein
MRNQVVGPRLALICALGACTSLAVAADKASSCREDAHIVRTSSALDDKGFITAAAQDNLTEVQLAELAMKQSQNDQVHQFAERMIKDHGKANQQLTALAQQKNIVVGKQLDPEHSAVVQRLSTKSGADFDAAYAKEMANDHKKAVALFKRASNTKDPLLAQFAKETLQTLEEHKQMADTLNSKIRSAAAKPSSSSQK